MITELLRNVLGFNKADNEVNKHKRAFAKECHTTTLIIRRRAVLHKRILKRSISLNIAQAAGIID